MPTREPGDQAHKHHRQDASESEAPTESAEVSEALRERQSTLDDDVDAILDEIDEVLESNAEDFVKSFIQKGGE